MVFLFALVLLDLFIIPLFGGSRGRFGGGVAMMVVSIIGIIGYLLLFQERLRSRGQIKTMVVVASTSCAVALVLGLVSWLIRSYSH